jgi:ATP-binding cassette, subfamily B, bacterial HlyB/CyaB
MIYTSLACLELVAQVNKIPMDIRSIVKEHGVGGDKDMSKEELVRIARRNGFKCRLKRIDVQKLSRDYPVPAIVVLRDGTYAVVFKASEQSVVIFYPKTKDVQKISNEDFVKLAHNEFIVLSQGIMSQNAKFGFRWFFEEIVRYKSIISEVLIASFVVQLFGLVTPIFTQVILDKVLVHHSISTLNVIVVAFVAVTLFELLLNLIRNHIFIHTANKIDAKLGSRIFEHLFSLPYAYFEANKVGNIIARVHELDSIRDFITNKSVSVIIDVFFSFVFFGAMVLYSVQLALIVLAFVVVTASIYLLATPMLRARLEEKFKTSAQSNSYLVESVTGIETVKSLATEGSMLKRWETFLAQYLRSNFKLANFSNIFGSLTSTSQRLMTIAILYFGVGLVIQGELTVGQLIAFQMFSGQFTGPIIRLVNLWNEFQQALISVDKVGDILNIPAERVSSKSLTLPEIKGDVRFDGVSFKYRSDTPLVLDNISFWAESGMSIGLVGRSGSGKSTATKLVQRLYTPDGGAIYIDGVDIRHLSPLWLRSNIGVVLQENFLFSGSIKDNIVLSRPDARFEEIMRASQIAGAHGFISEFSEGYDTSVGERGSTLSGGQRQRIAIARALITDPKILIFDEATSALDYESERIIQNNMKMIQEGRTVFIIAHRLTTVRDCDLIIALDKGKLVEMGSHDALMEKEGYYHHLYMQQMRD